jgi:hypothetical protein
MEEYCQIEDMVGLVFTKVISDSESVTFYLTDNDYFIFKHFQNCCESVWLEDVCGDLSDLENTPMVVAEELSYHPDFQDEDTDYGIRRWTFYNFRTNKGTVSLRFCGSSNGYYSVGVSLLRYKTEDNEDYYLEGTPMQLEGKLNR